MPADNAFDQILAGINGDDYHATEEYHNAAAEVTLEEQEALAEAAAISGDLHEQLDAAYPEQVAAEITTDANSRIAQSAWAAANPSLCTGRGPTGRLRNFPAMRDAKLMVTLRAVEAESNDPEALDNLLAEAQHRGLR